MEEGDQGHGTSAWGSSAKEGDDGWDADVKDPTGLYEHRRVFCRPLVLAAKGGSSGSDAQLSFIVADGRQGKGNLRGRGHRFWGVVVVVVVREVASGGSLQSSRFVVGVFIHLVVQLQWVSISRILLVVLGR